MSLSAGTRIGPYEIVALIGAGGMGEVYRGRDARLGRDVAIKVLPNFAADTDRMARFQREAKVLASLNHPHIAALYGLEEAGSVRALVMELAQPVFVAAAPQALFEARVPSTPPGLAFFTYAVAADGKRFLVNTSGGDAEAPLTVVVNWLAAVKK